MKKRNLAGLYGLARGQLEAELSTNPRMKWILLLLAGCLALAIIVSVMRVGAALETRVEQTRDELVSLRKIAKETDWPQRLNDTRLLRSQIEDRLWVAETAGLAEANFETWLRSVFVSSEMSPRRLSVQVAPIGKADDVYLGDILQLSARVVIPFSRDGLIKFLRTASTYQKVVVVDELVIKTGRNPGVEMQLFAPVIVRQKDD